MAKSTQHVDKIGSYEDFRAPWETESGEETEPNKATLKRLLYNVRVDLAKAKDAAEDLKAAVTAAETERDDAKTAAADGSGAEAQKQIDKLTADLAKVTGERDSLQGEKDQAELRKDVLGDFEAKNPKAAKYVTGTTKEELEASLEEVKADWGITDEAGDDEGDEDETPVVRTRPKATLSNPADPSNGKGGDAQIDFDKIADEIYAGGSVFK